jgi:hypothetical protein
MFKRFSTLFTCLLLVVIPLQGFAAANMAICKHVMQTNALQAMSDVTPCMRNMSSSQENLPNKQSTHCKLSCAALCASFSTYATLPSHLLTIYQPISTVTQPLDNQRYTSITLPNLLRPPIRLS